MNESTSHETPTHKSKPVLSEDLIELIVSELQQGDREAIERFKAKLLGIALDVMPTPQPKREAKKVTSIADIQLLVDEPFEVCIDFQGHDLILTGRRLRPFESKQLMDIIDRVAPPLVKAQKPGDKDWYNEDEPNHIKAKNEAALVARAIGLYLAYPVIREGKPNLTDHKAIFEHVQSIFNEAILRSLWETVKDGGVRKAAYVNF